MESRCAAGRSLADPSEARRRSPKRPACCFLEDLAVALDSAFDVLFGVCEGHIHLVEVAGDPAFEECSPQAWQEAGPDFFGETRVTIDKNAVDRSLACHYQREANFTRGQIESSA